MEEASRISAEAKTAGKTVVTINGCFDILHIGHVRALKESRLWGDLLIVGVDSDETIKKSKGPKRPMNFQEDRAEMLAHLPYVDYVTIFYSDNCIPFVEAVKPNIHANGPEYPRPWLEEEAVLKNGGECRAYTRHKNKNGSDYSTTDIIRKISEGNK